MDPRRSERISGTIRDELEEILNYELEDPRIGAVVIEEVILSPDGKRALVRVTPRGDSAAQTESLEALERARRHIRHLLAERLDVFRMPDVSFEAALAPNAAVKVKQTLRRIRKGRPRD